MTAAEDTATLDAALDWHAAGQRPIPIRADGSKAPIVPWTEFRRTRPDPAVIRRWFPAGTCRGIGIVTGTLTGTEMLECEHEAAARGFPDRIRDLLLASAHPEVWALLAGTYIEDSPSGGIHWYYRITGGDVPPNTPLARRPSTPAELQAEPTKPTRVLIETRGEGGYSVVAPTGGSVHKTGRPWTARDGCTPHRMAELTVDQVAELHRACRALDEMQAPRPHPPSPAGRSMAAGVFATSRPVTVGEPVPAALNGSNGSTRPVTRIGPGS